MTRFWHGFSAAFGYGLGFLIVMVAYNLIWRATGWHPVWSLFCR